MSDGGKRYKGQIQVVDGSPTGEPIVVTLIDHLTNGMPSYIGEAKYNTPTDIAKWYITFIQYDVYYNIIATTTALNRFTSNATNISVDVISYPGYAAVTAIGGDLTLLSVGDKVFLSTVNNSIGGNLVTQILSSTQFLVQLPNLIAETNTPVTPSDLIFHIENLSLKDFDNRVWDKRTLYLYG
jgi:hypothetical protein